MNETTQLQYLNWKHLYTQEKPYQVFVSGLESSEEFRDTNLDFKASPDLIIHDIRGHEAQFNLDDHGFAVGHHTSNVSQFDNVNSIERNYLPEMETLIRQEVDDVGRVFFFDWRIRRNERQKQLGKTLNMNDKMNHLLPARNVHVDQSAGSVLKRIKLQFGQEADQLLQGRVRIINIWKPLVEEVEDWPLVVCDGSSVKSADMIATDHVRRHIVGEVLYARYNPEHKWYYLSRQRRDEVLLIKNFDSDERVKANYCPHASFQHKQIRAEAPTRESIEVRAFVFSVTS